MKLPAFFDEDLQAVDAALQKLLPPETTPPSSIHTAMRYSVFAGGKRVRPILCLESARIFTADVSASMYPACAIEFIHTYSLIHDDLPALDNDDLRRGKSTCHRQFGEATAILAGDVLQTLAFKAIADDGLLGAGTRVSIISLLAQAAGTPAGMVSGQQLDVEAEGKTLPIAEIEQIHRQKTGALFIASAKIGAIIGGAEDDEIAAVGEYSSRLGLLFQVTDDLLDVTQATEMLGKTAGKDA